MTNIESLIAANLAQPMTHRIITTYDNGRTREHRTRNLSSANNWTIGERRKIGRKLIDRTTGQIVSIVSVAIETL